MMNRKNGNKRMFFRALFIIFFLMSAKLIFSIEIDKLLHLPQLLLLLSGTVLFYVSGNGLRIKAFDGSEAGRNAVLVGLLETMVLLVGSIQTNSKDLLFRI